MPSRIFQLHRAVAPTELEHQPQFYAPPTGGTANNLPVLNWDQAAAQITRDGVSWSSALGTPATVTYAFRATVSAADTTDWPAGVSGFSRFNATQISVTEEMLRLWSEAANITFVRVGAGATGVGAFSDNAQILFGNFTTGPAAFSAFTYFPPLMGQPAGDLDGNVWVNVSRNYDADPAAFPQGAHILAHEIGHAIGLNHPGDYNGGANGGATYTNDADFWQDTAMFSNMSYFSPSFTGANYGTGYALAPQMLDIAAAQRLYGANLTTRTGNTTYGFNSNAGHGVFSITNTTQIAIFCIWDAGGNDTLDLSGYATASQIDLREEAFSSAGPGVYNISIARGAVIENGVGGSGADTLIGNEANNTLTGNAGVDALSGNGGADTLIGGAANDTLNGGFGLDTASYSAAASASLWHRNPNGAWTVTTVSEGIDTLNGVERLHFSDRDVFIDPAKETLFGDGTSDIIFRNVAASGATAMWGVQGAAITSQATIGFVDGTWTLSAGGDFNGDGKSDLIWLHNDGVAVEWQMNGGAIVNAAVIGTLGSTWHVAGTGDFNLDGLSDIVWRNDSGAIAVWTMNGATPTSSATIGAVDNTWTISGVADFDGDGRDEILWRHNDGLVATWATDGVSITGAGNLGYVGTDWTLAGTGDFNDDGRADILWLHDGDGAAVIWEMNGSTIASAGLVASVGAAWHVANVGDYNGDGMSDILWRNDNGALAVWTMNGFNVTASGVVGSVDSNWTII